MLTNLNARFTYNVGLWLELFRGQVSFLRGCFSLPGLPYKVDFPGGSEVKNLPAMQDTWVQSLVWEKIPWRRKWWPTPVFLPGESHGQRSLAGYSPWGCKESDTTEQPPQPYKVPWAKWLKIREVVLNGESLKSRLVELIPPKAVKKGSVPVDPSSYPHDIVPA